MGYEARRKKVLEDTNSINDKAKQNLTETQYDLWQKQVEEKMKAFNAKEAAKTDKMYLFYSIIYVLCILLAISAVVVGVFFILRDLEPRPETTYVGPNRITSIIFELILTEGMIGVVIFGIKALRKGVVAIITRIIFALLLYLGNSYVFRNLEENPLIEVSYLPFILCLVLYIIGSACSTKADYMLKKSDNVKRMDNYL